MAPLTCIKLVLPSMVARGSGLIINVTSDVAWSDPPAPAGDGGWGLGYAISKGALHRVAGVLAQELAGTGVSIVNLSPGFVATERIAIDAHVKDLEAAQAQEQGNIAAALADPSAPILGPSLLTPAQLVAWYHSTGRRAATSVPIEVLAQLYVDEGDHAGVRGDVAFAESVLDTDAFTFPAEGSLSGKDNGLSLVSGCDVCADIATYPSAAVAVRAQMQLLRVFADPDVTEATLGAPPVVPHILETFRHGTIVSWRQLPGLAQTEPDYGKNILQTYADITKWVAAHPTPPGA
jgi:hypothetical protein